MSADLQQLVAQSADSADMHATVPTLLLELQTLLGRLTANATASTERGRRPFRPGDGWHQAVGELAYGVYQLADQSGVEVDREVSATAVRLQQQARHVEGSGSAESWPFETR